MAGIRIGTLYTENRDLVEALAKLGPFHGISGTTQHQVARLLQDRGMDPRVTCFCTHNVKKKKITLFLSFCTKQAVCWAELKFVNANEFEWELFNDVCLLSGDIIALFSFFWNDRSSAWGFCCTSRRTKTRKIEFTLTYCHFSLSRSRLDQQGFFAREQMQTESCSQLPDRRAAGYGRPLPGQACCTLCLGWPQKGNKMMGLMFQFSLVHS